MTTRLACVGVLVLCVAAPAGAVEPSPAQRLWEQGQDALRDGRTDEAMQLYQRSLALDPTLADDHLSLAACYLDKGDDEHAGEELARYLEARPHHCTVRAHYAELLVRLNQIHAARREYERLDADAQDQDEVVQQELVHCHSRLMQLAEMEDDDFAAHLHRGIGLYLLARQQASLPDDEDGHSPESLLCKAAGELILASRQRPDEARPCWYLFAVWSQLAQRQPAARWLRQAEAAAPFSYLTPAERRRLETAVRSQDAEARRK
jgi:thioredoxin-like negative regulator of GroEL